jgi:hypothetical protein
MFSQRLTSSGNSTTCGHRSFRIGRLRFGQVYAVVRNARPSWRCSSYSGGLRDSRRYVIGHNLRARTRDPADHPGDLVGGAIMQQPEKRRRNPLPVHQIRHTPSLSQISKLPEKRTLRAANRARWDETDCGSLLTVDYQRTIDQFVKSFDRLVALHVNAAKGSLVSKVTQRVQPGDEGLAVGLASGLLPSGLLGQ